MQKFYKVHGLMSNYGKSSGILMSHLTLIKKMICYVLVSLSHTLLRLVKLDENGFPSLCVCRFSTIIVIFSIHQKNTNHWDIQSNKCKNGMMFCFLKISKLSYLDTQNLFWKRYFSHQSNYWLSHDQIALFNTFHSTAKKLCK